MLEASAPVLFLDFLRIPYAVVGDDGLEDDVVIVRGPLGSLSWPQERALPQQRRDLPGSPVPCRFLDDERAGARLGSGWERLGDSGFAAAAWGDGGGAVFLAFDPDETIQSLRSERYEQSQHRRRLVLRGYYSLRPLLPRPLQIQIRRRYAALQARRRFPRWPIEPALPELFAFLVSALAALVDEPLPWIAPWPDGAKWALVMTHDVEEELGYRNLGLLRDVEVSLGFRSCWNFVPKRYEVEDETVAALTAEGFEIGVHGLYHDGRDLESERTLRERLPEIRRYAERWGAVGFRSPATHRRWELMPLLGFDYDSSSPDTDPFEPQSGGCCSLLPFFNGELVELPITLPQDHTLFVILGHHDEDAWVRKAEAVRDEGGMALLITHPDYMLADELLAAYERFLRRFSDDRDLWRALPREVSSWWRRRAASRLERVDGRWQVVGPAEGSATVALIEPSRSAA
jgi:hypothetical protein